MAKSATPTSALACLRRASWRCAMVGGCSGVRVGCAAELKRQRNRGHVQEQAEESSPANKRPESMAPLRRTLSRRKKVELVDTLLELAQADRGVLRQLTARFDPLPTTW